MKIHVGFSFYICAQYKVKYATIFKRDAALKRKRKKAFCYAKRSSLYAHLEVNLIGKVLCNLTYA